MSVTRWVYDHSPVFWQNVMCSVSGAVRQWQRYRHPFGERRAFFCEAGKWSRAHAEDYQTAKVREMLQAAYDAVPFYRDRFEQVDRTPFIGGQVAASGHRPGRSARGVDAAEPESSLAKQQQPGQDQQEEGQPGLGLSHAGTMSMTALSFHEDGLQYIP